MKAKDSAQLYSMIEIKDKNWLRRHFTAVRKAEKHIKKDRRIAERLLSLELVQDADIILMYASFGSEIDTWNISEKLLERHASIAYPLCIENSEMTFHIAASLSQLRSSKGKYGICEPDSSLPIPALTDKSVCIVPGLAFTEKGGRLGYGGGYYDRFLARHSYLRKISLSYEALIASELPIMPYDLRTDIIITEERTVLCNAE